MGKNHFTAEQLENLQKNPYVERISIKSITYTEKFREEFYSANTDGKGSTIILRDKGFDTAVLGRSLINSIVQRAKKYDKRMWDLKILGRIIAVGPKLKKSHQKNTLNI